MSAKSSSSDSSGRPRLYLIDGMSNVFRVLRDPQPVELEGRADQRGFRLPADAGQAKDEEPEYIGIAFDVSTDTHRKRIFEA